MNESQTVEITVDTATQLTKLVASYGIYALVILYMFFQQYRERKNLLEAKTPAERAYYQKRGTLVLWVTILLSAVAAGVWFYGTFLYQPKILIEGTLKNLREQPAMPARLGDPPMVVYRLDAFRGDVQFYSTKQASLSGSSFDLDWVLISPRGLNTLQLIFQQEFCYLDEDLQAALFATSDAPSVPKAQRGAPIKTARIDFRAHEALRHEQIHLVYEPASDVKKIGKLFIVSDEGPRTEIPWDEDSPTPDETKSEHIASLFGTGVAWAQGEESSSIFGPKGEVAPDVFERLKIYLGSEDLKQQLLAQETLVQGGAQSFSTAEKILMQAKSSDHRSRNRLVHNIASAVEKIEASQTRISPNLSVMLAQSLFDIGDYELAARFFSRVPGSQRLSSQAIHQRAISYLNTQRYDEAEADLRMLSQTKITPGQKTAVLTNLGTVYSRKNRWEAAKDSYRQAIAVEPKNVTALANLGSVEQRLGNLDEAERALERAYYINPKSPLVLNGLAYVYALQGKNLDKALLYVDQALASSGDLPHFLDTKGWVLYKRGQPRLALQYLEKAQRKEPENDVIKSHMEEVRNALPPTLGS